MNLLTYFDAAASTPLDPQVSEVIRAHLDLVGNNNSKHVAGFAGQRCIDESLKTIATVLGCNWEQLSICYSGTDANRRVIMACRELFGETNLYASEVEHSSIADEIPQKFNPVTLVELPKNPACIALMGANSETGRIYDAAEVRAKYPNSFIIRDYSQSFAKGIIPDLQNCDAGIFTPQKFYGPKNIGILYLKHPEKFPEISKDSHTKFPALVAGAAKAFEIWGTERETHQAQMTRWEAVIREYIHDNISDYKFHDLDHARVPGLISVAFKGLRGGEIMTTLSKDEGICLSIGSACTSDIMAPTDVIKSIEPDPDWQYPIRISLHKFLTDEAVTDFCEILAHYVEELR